MKRYTFKNGDVITSKLNANELMKRLQRLDVLIVMTEQSDCEIGMSITSKAIKAYNKMENFTGIIRLTSTEKDWLSYKLESEFIDDERRKVIEYYCK